MTAADEFKAGVRRWLKSGRVGVGHTPWTRPADLDELFSDGTVPRVWPLQTGQLGAFNRFGGLFGMAGISRDQISS